MTTVPKPRPRRGMATLLSSVVDSTSMIYANLVSDVVASVIGGFYGSIIEEVVTTVRQRVNEGCFDRARTLAKKVNEIVKVMANAISKWANINPTTLSWPCMSCWNVIIRSMDQSRVANLKGLALHYMGQFEPSDPRLTATFFEASSLSVCITNPLINFVEYLITVKSWERDFSSIQIERMMIHGEEVCLNNIYAYLFKSIEKCPQWFLQIAGDIDPCYDMSILCMMTNTGQATYPSKPALPKYRIERFDAGCRRYRLCELASNSFTLQ